MKLSGIRGVFWGGLLVGLSVFARGCGSGGSSGGGSPIALYGAPIITDTQTLTSTGTSTSTSTGTGVDTGVIALYGVPYTATSTSVLTK